MSQGKRASSAHLLNSVLLFGALLIVLAGLVVATLAQPSRDATVSRDPDDEDALALNVKARRASGVVREGVIEAAPAASALKAPANAGTGFIPQTRVGYSAGEQWEPAIAADRFNHIYILYPQYAGVPGCVACPSPTLILQVSNDGGVTWGAPRQIAPPGSGQWDAQIAVDPVDGRTVYAAWLQNNKGDTVVACSDDLGATWSVVVADSTNAGTDKPILTVRGPHVYVGFNHAQKVWVAASHDGGHTFSAVNINPNGKLGWSLAGGGTVDPSGNVYFAWAGYKQSGGGKGPVNLYISRSSDGGRTWSSAPLDTSGAPPDCSAYACGWAFLGAQMTLTSDASGALYALWNAGAVDQGPERVYFARSTDGGATWMPKQDVSTAAQGVSHAFPAIAAAGTGDVRISWMDARRAPWWNVYYRSSTDGGMHWTAETRLSTYVAGFDYITPDGFRFPYGDYYEMDIDAAGITHLVWGEGQSYNGAGSIWYTRGK
jgi:hypothetical protein